MRQIHVPNDAPSDRSQEVLDLLKRLHAEYSLFDNTLDSDVPDTIVSLTEGQYQGFGMGARRVGNRIIIDFVPKRARDLEKCQKLEQELFTSVREKFPDMLVPEDNSMIPIPPPTPQGPPGAKERVLKYWEERDREEREQSNPGVEN
jgi:hypothetical protein